MAFGLTIGTERANTLQVRKQFSTQPPRFTSPPPQTAIQNELASRGWGTEPDVTMAEYITIMLINGKSEDQINSELMDRASQALFDFFSRLLIEYYSRFTVIGPDYGMCFAPFLHPSLLTAVFRRELWQMAIFGGRKRFVRSAARPSHCCHYTTQQTRCRPRASRTTTSKHKRWTITT